MSGEEFSGRAFALPIDAAATGNVWKTTEIVLERIATQPTVTNNILNVELASLPDVQIRKITPESEAVPTFFAPRTDPKPGSILDRLTAFFMPGALDAKPETSLAKFASLSKAPGETRATTEKIADAMNELEKSQQFATGTVLMSSLTQSVMSSSKRLTQGQ
jgi:hypothetical protein